MAPAPEQPEPGVLLHALVLVLGDRGCSAWLDVLLGSQAVVPSWAAEQKQNAEWLCQQVQLHEAVSANGLSLQQVVTADNISWQPGELLGKNINSATSNTASAKTNGSHT